MCSGFRSLIGHNSSLFRHIIGIHQFYYPANSQRAISFNGGGLNLQNNISDLVWAGAADWTAGYIRSRRKGSKLKGYLIFMPTFRSRSIIAPLETKLAKIGDVPVKLVFGTSKLDRNKNPARGRLFGLGVHMGTLRELIRMDFHNQHEKRQKNEVAYWTDGDFHYHVVKWNQ